MALFKCQNFWKLISTQVLKASASGQAWVTHNADAYYSLTNKESPKTLYALCTYENNAADPFPVSYSVSLTLKNGTSVSIDSWLTDLGVHQTTTHSGTYDLSQYKGKIASINVNANGSYTDVTAKQYWNDYWIKQ